jgi:AbiJ N-terminal domain 4
MAHPQVDLPFPTTPRGSIQVSFVPAQLPRGIIDVVAVRDIFSKRGKPVPAKDVLTYDALPQPLCAQIIHIWATALGTGQDEGYFEPGFSAQIWKNITFDLMKELGVFSLVPNRQGFEAAAAYLVEKNPPIANAIDLIELSFRAIDTVVRDNWWALERRSAGITQEPDDAITELNHRFLEHGVGYQYANGKIIRLDTTFTHAEVLRPALTVLSNPVFKNAQAEFLRAHEAYREGRYSDSLNESLKAFESAMKIICTQMGWTYGPTDTASRLIGVVLDNGLVPSSMQTQFGSLKQLLESGTPTARNKNSGHGQGPVEVVVTDYLAVYGLNTAAANITLLAAAFEEKKRRK